MKIATYQKSQLLVYYVIIFQIINLMKFFIGFFSLSRYSRIIINLIERLKCMLTNTFIWNNGSAEGQKVYVDIHKCKPPCMHVITRNLSYQIIKCAVAPSANPTKELHLLFVKKKKSNITIRRSSSSNINKLNLCARIFDVLKKSRHRRVLFYHYA